jgi:glycosyltransferase involved in cell wall biosynthesis
VGNVPTVLWTDVTPALLDAPADQYAHAVDASGPVRALKKALVRRTFQRAALCVGWSNWARQSFVADYGVQDAKTDVVPPGVDLSRWLLPVRKPDGKVPRLLFVGGDFARKGGDLLIEVFRQHLRGRCELDLVTRDPVPEEPGVRVHRGLTAGSAPLLALYRAASVFVLPTRGDCFSIASIEAMAMGLPVVVSDVGGISEIVEPGESGYLIGAGNGRELSAALENLIDHPERVRGMGLRGRARAEERFDARRTAERLLGLIGSSIAAAPGRAARASS